MMDFKHFKHGVAEQFARMVKGPLFRTQIDKDLLWRSYLAAFPEGTNPIFRERTEHDCACCRSFIRAVGDVVAIEDGNLVSIWDGHIKDPTYAIVAAKMAEVVKSYPIENVFLHEEPRAGVDRNYEDLLEGRKTWEHFFVHIPSSFVSSGSDRPSREIGPGTVSGGTTSGGSVLGRARARHDVLLRGLREIRVDALDTVLDLIAQNSLYRGEEKKRLVETFRKLKVAFDQLGSEAAEDLFAWSQVEGPESWVCGFRNDVIGTLAVDLSEGVDLERAVSSFESKVAPSNYKRPTALVTKGMIEKARQTVEGLGLTSALERRYAVLTDIAAPNVIFADRNAKKVMGGSVFDDLSATAPVNVKKFDKVEEVPIERFISEIIPRTTSIEVLLENRHEQNLVSLIAPTDPTAAPLFKWQNGFSWSYHGEVADSIKARVKAAGGDVTGDVCCRLAWFNHDDLDLHMKEPDGSHIYYGSYRALSGSRTRTSPNGGLLDVDMNAGSGSTRKPVENIFYKRASSMEPGRYRLFVHNFARRESVDVGFEVEIDILGTVHRFSHPQAVAHDASVDVAVIEKTPDGEIKIIESLPSTETPKEMWGLNTQAFHRVNLLTLSPNHWGEGGIGNRHYFFFLEGCRNEGKARPFYNEFLRGDLDPHRKVLELVGSKMRIEEADEQLSGLGFSSTQRNSVLCRVTGAFTRTLKILF